MATGKTGSIQSGIQPPKNAREIFMGCGNKESNVIKMGIIVEPEDLFDQRAYPSNQEVKAKKVKEFYTYYTSGKTNIIGFSGSPNININSYDQYNQADTTKLSADATSS